MKSALMFILLAVVFASFLGNINNRAQISKINQALQEQSDHQAVTDLANDINGWKCVHGTLPTSVERADTPSYGSPIDNYPFHSFVTRWPEVQLEETDCQEIDCVYSGDGFAIYRYRDPKGKLHLQYRNREAEQAHQIHGHGY